MTFIFYLAQIVCKIISWYSSVMTFEEVKAEIIAHPHFQKLKTVTENNPWHHHESVYDHSLKTFTAASQSINGPFLTNAEAKTKFEEFMNSPMGDFKRKDILEFIALLHDIGKALSFNDNGEVFPILIKKPDGNTQCPGHDYWGSTLLPDILDGILPDETIAYMANIIKIHDTFPDSYFAEKKDWPIEMVVSHVKSQGQSMYKECLFNIYCDNFNADVSTEARKKIEEIFNHPALYTDRIYTVL